MRWTAEARLAKGYKEALVFEEEAGASRPQGRMAVVNADTLRMLAEEKARGDAGPRPRDKKRRRKRK